MKKVIATGSPDTQDQAIAWLQEHGATIEQCSGVTLITLPEHAQLDQGAYPTQFTIGFSDTQGNPEDLFVSVSLRPDANQTELHLES